MRHSWDKYFLLLARQAAEMSTCPRLHVGAVIVKGKQVIATGFNGAPRGLPHCTDVGCLMVNGHCVRTVHAEANALLFAGAERTKGATLYCTHAPCLHCAGLAVNAGIGNVVFAERYGGSAGLDLLRAAHIPVWMVNESPAASARPERDELYRALLVLDDGGQLKLARYVHEAQPLRDAKTTVLEFMREQEMLSAQTESR